MRTVSSPSRCVPVWSICRWCCAVLCLRLASRSALTWQEHFERTKRLGSALHKAGIRRGDRVATFMWNTDKHLQCYHAVPSLGAILHTLNIRLNPEELAFIINDAEDKVRRRPCALAGVRKPFAVAAGHHCGRGLASTSRGGAGQPQTAERRVVRACDPALSACGRTAQRQPCHARSPITSRCVPQRNRIAAAGSCAGKTGGLSRSTRG